MKTIDKIITPVNCKFGAPMGRSNVIPQNLLIVETCKKFLVDPITKESMIIFDCAVPLNNGGYDKGGCYFGLPKYNLRVSYTKDLSYINFYRKNY